MENNVQPLKAALYSGLMLKGVIPKFQSVLRDVMVSSQALHKKVTVNQ